MMIFQLMMKDTSDDNFHSAGVFVNSECASGDDYMSFLAGVIQVIRHKARADLESQAAMQGRTLEHGMIGVGSVVQVADKQIDVDLGTL